MKRKLIIITTALMLAASTPVLADDDVHVTVNGQPVAFDDSGAVIIGSRTMIPLRGVFELLGYTVDWDESTKTATLTGDDVIKITVGASEFYDDDVVKYAEVPAQIINDRLYLPLRAVGEAAGKNIRWDQHTKTACIEDHHFNWGGHHDDWDDRYDDDRDDRYDDDRDDRYDDDWDDRYDDDWDDRYDDDWDDRYDDDWDDRYDDDWDDRYDD